MNRHTLSVYVENEPGILSRVVGLFSGRGFNIESLNVAPTQDHAVSHMTIVTRGDEQIVEQVIKQLRKLIGIIKVVDYAGVSTIEREMMFVRVQADDTRRAEVLRIADIFRCKVVDVSLTELTLEVTGDYEKLQAVSNLLVRFGIKESARTGTLAMRRSMQPAANDNHDM
jgi:acetolactate synthase-1/3 small subunit